MTAPIVSVKKKRSKSYQLALSIFAGFLVLIGLVLLYLLTQATTNRSMYEQNYELLFRFNFVIAVVLVVSIILVGFRLVMRLKQRRFGSRLLMKLAFVFAFVGIAPGVLIYVVSYQFVERSIETWFDVKVEGALSAGMHLGRASIDSLSGDLNNKARWLAQQLAEGSSHENDLALNKWLDRVDVSDLTIWSGSGRLIASAGASKFMLSPSPPSSSQLMIAKADGSLSWVDGLDDESTENAVKESRLRALARIPNTSLNLDAPDRYVLLTKHFPQNLAINAIAVEKADREYQERLFARNGLKRMYIGTLTLSLILAVFAAMLLAIILGDQMLRPLMLLADGMTAVAAGDLRPKVVFTGRDELGTLTRAFASMTHQLSDARLAAETSMEQLDAARGSLQTILDNLTTGVMVLTPMGDIKSVNPGAKKILSVGLASSINSEDALLIEMKKFVDRVQHFFIELQLSQTGLLDGGVDHWQRMLELNAGSEPNTSVFDKQQTLMVRGAQLPDASRLIVFDDITEVISAQRAQAWGEVARRLAHEIKNPLTPIRLSAERLEMKLNSKLEGVDKAFLGKSVKTIVDQVDALRRLVDEFRDYARLPAAKLEPVDLNALIHELVGMYEGSFNRPVTLELEQSCDKVHGDPGQLRQVLHNLLQNAQDATDAALTDNAQGEKERKITVRTQFFPLTKQVRLSVIDGGPGFSERLLKRAFEPYVTTKSKGTGLGLAVVKKIAEEHGGHVDLLNRMQEGKILGAQVSLTLRAVS